MMTNYFRFILASVFVFSSLVTTFSSTVNAQGNDVNLLRQGDVTLTAWVGLEPEEGIQSFSIKEQVILTLEVATPRRFTKGTRLVLPEVPNVLIKLRNQFAMNYTERVKNARWSIQRWEVVMYPMTSGTFTIPSFGAFTQVIDSEGEHVDIPLYTKPLTFKAHLPSAKITEQTSWLAASELTAEQSWEFSAENLKVGDAITRSINVSASDTLAVLIPELLTAPVGENYQRYSKPVRFSDTSNRGEYSSKKNFESVYVLQEGGEYSIPSTSIIFWNTEEEALETIVLEGETVKVSHTVKSLFKAYWLIVTKIVLMILSIFALCYFIYRYYQTHPLPPFIALLKVLKRKQWNVARTLMYRHQRIVSGKVVLADEASVSVIEEQQLQAGSKSSSLFVKLWFRIRQGAK